uniref:Uncharacterized protein n=1 Tax=Cyprinodon variegatus TaxID=28743 RepID=A0A3Q2C8J3_CYPVA
RVCRPSTVLTLAVCCDWLTHYSHLRNSSMVLIEVMGGPLTNQTSPVEFPYNLYKRMMNRQVSDLRLLFIRDSMTQIYDLYRYNDMSLAAWDSVKTTDFLESIHRQIRELDECDLLQQLKEPDPAGESQHLIVVLTKVLFLQGGSKDGWEIVRKETKKHLTRLDRLGNLVLAAICVSSEHIHPTFI